MGVRSKDRVSPVSVRELDWVKHAANDFKRYASLFFIAGISQDENELIVLEIIHRYVEILDRYFGNVSCI